MTNALLSAVRRKRADLGKALELLNSLSMFRIEVALASADFYAAALMAASEFKLTAYDAAYLVLAQQRQTSLATTDRQLRKAALFLGVALLEAEAEK